MWLASKVPVCHASVVPKSWQRTKKASLVMEAFKLARPAPCDASAPRNGGMSILVFIYRSRSLRGSGQGPDGGVVRGRRRPLTAGHGVAQTPTNTLFATMPPLCQRLAAYIERCMGEPCVRPKAWLWVSFPAVHHTARLR